MKEHLNNFQSKPTRVIYNMGAHYMRADHNDSTPHRGKKMFVKEMNLLLDWIYNNTSEVSESAFIVYLVQSN